MAIGAFAWTGSVFWGAIEIKGDFTDLTTAVPCLIGVALLLIGFAYSAKALGQSWKRERNFVGFTLFGAAIAAYVSHDLSIAVDVVIVLLTTACGVKALTKHLADPLGNYCLIGIAFFTYPLLYIPLRLPGSDISAEHLDQLLAVPFTTVGMMIFAVGFAQSREKIISTVNALNESKDVIKKMLYTDPDTGLPSRQRQLEWAEELTAAGTPFAIIGIFFRNYSQVYSNFGMQYGNAIVAEFVNALKEILPPGYQLGKSLGMRFSIVATGDIDDAILASFANRIIERMKTPFQLEDAAIMVQVSIGSSTYPDDGVSLADVIRNAYTALTEAEQLGEPAYCRFSEELVKKSQYLHWLDHNLRLAFDRSEFTLHYQPKVDLRDGSCNAVEALIRWTHSEAGSIRPDQFIPRCESNGLIIALGHWIISTAASNAAMWSARGCPMRIAINISVQQLRDPELLPKLHEAQTIAGGLLDFELTESCFMSNDPHFLELISQIRHLKFGIHLDDFGTGYSSLSRLKDLPLTVLKLDRVFVQDIANASRGQKLLRAMIHLARELELQVVAEGVETQEQASFLKAHGVEFAQGWLYARAMPSEDLLAWYSVNGKYDYTAVSDKT
ncbi:putative bifunctional diguanylate cyclase/phosphodiesterase [Undibacterium sp. Ren11W]|uniref:putative bifunctional diguanylate cyclase/phosphodiesterase n=1 Tax=Undibacterium sp. Ren11W TaxID=3413045 RepID=UPI003BF03894